MPALLPTGSISHEILDGRRFYQKDRKQEDEGEPSQKQKLRKERRIENYAEQK